MVEVITYRITHPNGFTENQSCKAGENIRKLMCLADSAKVEEIYRRTISNQDWNYRR
jgi:hypothetical protein